MISFFCFFSYLISGYEKPLVLRGFFVCFFCFVFLFPYFFCLSFPLLLTFSDYHSERKYEIQPILSRSFDYRGSGG